MHFKHKNGSSSTFQALIKCLKIKHCKRVIGSAHQRLQGADVFELVSAQVEVRQADQPLGQNLQTAGDTVVTQLQLGGRRKRRIRR